MTPKRRTPKDEWTPEMITAILGNPIYAIDIDPDLAIPHQKIIAEDAWIAANVKVIADVGAEQWLRTLLETLKGGYV